MEGVVDLSALPEVMQEDGELSGDRDDRALLGVLPAALGELEPPAAQFAIRTEGTQEVLGALDQQPAEIAVPGLACPGGLGQG